MTSLKHPSFRKGNSGHQLGGVLIPSKYALTHTLGHLIGSSIVWCVSEYLSVADLADGVVLNLGMAPLTVVEHQWSLSIPGTVILGHTRGYVAKWVGEC